MDEILRQLGDLGIGSVPTMILFLLLVLAYRFLVYGPLTRTLADKGRH
jgi:F-type H+-transporting ATPase subunit b